MYFLFFSEKCYTIAGLELSRVTVVNSSLQIVYDTFVKPKNEVIDYNTRYENRTYCKYKLRGGIGKLDCISIKKFCFI